MHCPICKPAPTLVQIMGNVWQCPECSLQVITGRNTKEVRENLEPP